MYGDECKNEVETQCGENKIRVFLADASEDFLALMRAELGAAGDFVLAGTATDGEAAFRALCAAPPELLVADVLLPGLDGLELLRRLRTEGLRFPVMFLSAFSSPQTARRAAEYGAADFLLKPCCIPYLVRRIRRAARDGAPVPDCVPEIREALREFGVPQHLSGYDFLAEALARTVEDRSLLRGVTKVLYPEVAARFSTSAECVERSIRSALEKAWTPRTEPRRRQAFGDAFAHFVRTPTNARFLALMTDLVAQRRIEHLWSPAPPPRRARW